MRTGRNKVFSCWIFALMVLGQHGFGQEPFSRRACWIQPGFSEDTVERPSPVFRKEFILREQPKMVRLIITAHGLYVAETNDKRVGADWFTPGFTSYHQRLQYQVYDISSLTHSGTNLLTVTVGDGWWRGKFGADLKNDRYGKDAGLLAQLEVSYPDGSYETIVTDSSWSCTTGPIRYADLYTGEMQDTRFGYGPWSRVIFGEGPGSNLTASICEPVREHEQFHPVRIFTTPKGEQVLDFGQNLAGWVRFTVKGKSGDTIRLAHAETLDADSNFYTGNLRLAKAEDVYVLRGGRQVLSPHFTYHGFRYVRVEGYPSSLKPKNFTAVALYSDLTPAGYFECSNPVLNQLQNNILWSQKSNFFDIPTDCPQRSERFGWTGDAQVFCRTAAFNMDVKAFFMKWLADLAAQQGSNGGLPVYIPDFRTPDSIGMRGGVAGWGDAATILPWTLYEIYGDTAILRQQYASMRAWVDYIRQQAAPKNFLWDAESYGDWYAPAGPTDIGYIDECFFAHSIDLVVRTAQVLGKTDDAAFYGRLLKTVKTMLLSTYLRADETLPPTQTAYVLALQFDLLPENLRVRAAQQLVTLIHGNQDHLATGFLGTPYLLQVLTRFGYSDIAFTLLNQTTPPSWLYPLTKGATTIWEKWEAVKPDGSFDVSSLNHYAYGAVGDWLYRYVAGIEVSEPGYRKIIIQPHMGCGISWVKASYRSPFGTIVSNWVVKGRWLKLTVVIPANTTATILMLGKRGMKRIEAGPGRYHPKVLLY